MKTINGFKAQEIISMFSVDGNGSLINFERTGIIMADRVRGYHAEIDEILAHSHMYLKYEGEKLELLKKYFNKYAPLPEVVENVDVFKRFTLVDALRAIHGVFPVESVTSISYEDGSGKRFNISVGDKNYYVSLSDTGIINSIISL